MPSKLAIEDENIGRASKAMEKNPRLLGRKASAIYMVPIVRLMVR